MAMARTRDPFPLKKGIFGAQDARWLQIIGPLSPENQTWMTKRFEFHQYALTKQWYVMLPHVDLKRERQRMREDLDRQKLDYRPVAQVPPAVARQAMLGAAKPPNSPGPLIVGRRQKNARLDEEKKRTRKETWLG